MRANENANAQHAATSAIQSGANAAMTVGMANIAVQI
jgi:hypothetical protein